MQKIFNQIIPIGLSYGKLVAFLWVFFVLFLLGFVAFYCLTFWVPLICSGIPYSVVTSGAIGTGIGVGVVNGCIAAYSV